MNKTTVSDLNLHTKTVIKGCFFFKKKSNTVVTVCPYLTCIYLTLSDHVDQYYQNKSLKKIMKEWIFLRQCLQIFFQAIEITAPPPHPIFYYVNFIEKMYNVTGQQTHSFALYVNHDIKKMFTTNQKRYANF